MYKQRRHVWHFKLPFKNLSGTRLSGEQFELYYHMAIIPVQLFFLEKIAEDTLSFNPPTPLVLFLRGENLFCELDIIPVPNSCLFSHFLVIYNCAKNKEHGISDPLGGRDWTTKKI